MRLSKAINHARNDGVLWENCELFYWSLWLSTNVVREVSTKTKWTQLNVFEPSFVNSTENEQRKMHGSNETSLKSNRVSCYLVTVVVCITLNNSTYSSSSPSPSPQMWSLKPAKPRLCPSLFLIFRRQVINSNLHF